MLVVWRREGKGMFIGRTVRATVTQIAATFIKVAVEAPVRVAVSEPGVSTEEHLVRQMDREAGTMSTELDVTSYTLRPLESITIARGITFTFLALEGPREARIGVDAPRHVAVSRDDFTAADHMQYQMRREVGREPSEV